MDVCTGPLNMRVPPSHKTLSCTHVPGPLVKANTIKTLPFSLPLSPPPFDSSRSFFFVKNFSLSISHFSEREKQIVKKREREMAVSKVSSFGVVAIIFAIILQMAQAQSPAPAPAPTSDGRLIFLFILDLLVFCLIPKK